MKLIFCADLPEHCTCDLDYADYLEKAYQTPLRVACVEQLDRPHRGSRRFEKRATARAMRRTGKALLGDAPHRTPFRGYYD